MTSDAVVFRRRSRRWHLEVAIDVVHVGKPDEFILAGDVLAHLSPLLIKMEAVIVDVVSKCDVEVPCDRVADNLVLGVLNLSLVIMCTLFLCRTWSVGRISPLTSSKLILWLGDVNVGGNDVKERLRGRCEQHGGWQQLAIDFA